MFHVGDGILFMSRCILLLLGAAKCSSVKTQCKRIYSFIEQLTLGFLCEGGAYHVGVRSLLAA